MEEKGVKNVWYSRKCFLSLVALFILLCLGLRGGDVAMAVVFLTTGASAATVVQAIGISRSSRENTSSCQKQSQDKGNA
jgi:hypothetical protein